jgi:hypothetical protein
VACVLGTTGNASVATAFGVGRALSAILPGDAVNATTPPGIVGAAAAACSAHGQSVSARSARSCLPLRSGGPVLQMATRQLEVAQFPSVYRKVRA